ncbi:unnamed protein product [Vicia faba]|uniref:Uncharacterized protein n=1 Tax=Vicia faba TaxID=3906 RepID=A0AAV1AH24_VICFA|nr:unnamed protein product [Vicia faba]
MIVTLTQPASQESSSFPADIPGILPGNSVNWDTQRLHATQHACSAWFPKNNVTWGNSEAPSLFFLNTVAQHNSDQHDGTFSISLSSFKHLNLCLNLLLIRLNLPLDATLCFVLPVISSLLHSVHTQAPPCQIHTPPSPPPFISSSHSIRPSSTLNSFADSSSPCLVRG